jgi:serine/threonine-protein kinase
MRRYHPIGPLLSGEGSRAVLGLALEEGLPPQPVVIVWAAPEQLRDSSADQLFEETKRAVELEHPNILRVHGMVLLAGLPARVTAYADGEPLRRVLEVGQRLPPALAALVLTDAAQGVHHAHLRRKEDGSPFVHGDLRPETLMVRFDGVCQVTGYGALGVAPREVNGRRVPNRRRYSAPEQLREGREAITVQTDVLLLGLVLYECLTGKIPFQDAPAPDEAALTEELPPLPDDVPRALDAVVRKATAKAAGERYPTALAFHDALVAALGELPPRTALAEHLAAHFPPDGEVRKARRQVIQAGLTDALERLGMLPH